MNLLGQIAAVSPMLKFRQSRAFISFRKEKMTYTWGVAVEICGTDFAVTASELILVLPSRSFSQGTKRE